MFARVQSSIVRVLSICAAAVFVPAAALAQPANDFCVDATFIALSGSGSRTIGVSTVGATASIAESGCSSGSPDGRDVWFRIVAPVTGNYQMRTENITFDTTLSVWQGDCDFFGPGTFLECNDDFDFIDFSSAFIVSLVAGTEVKIRVAGIGAPGTCTLRIVVPAGTVISGACCTNNTCTTGVAGTCEGTFQGPNTTCSPTLCGAPSALCCLGATCRVNATSTTCLATGSAGAVLLSLSTCNLAGNTQAPCCYGNYNKNSEIDVPDIFAFLDDWFAQRPAAVVGGDGQTGTPQVPDIFAFLGAWFAGC